VVNYYFISASNVHGEGPFSGTVSSLASGLPGRVEGLSAHLLPHGLILTWGDVDHDGGSAISAYRIYRSETPYEDGRAVLEKIPSGTNEYEDTTIEVGTTYYYWISAVNENGEGPMSNVSSALPAVVPGSIDTVLIGSSLSRISLQWKAPDNDGGMNIINYRVYRGTSTADLRPYTIVDGGTTSILDDLLDQQAEYFYSVSAINEIGEGAMSNIVSAVTTGDPDGPQITYAGSGRSSISLRWEPPVNDGGSPVDRYLVELEVKGAGIQEEHATKDTQITAVGLVEGRIYAVQVTCINSNGGMGTSDILYLLVGDHADPPKSIDVKGEDGYVILTWEARSLESIPVTSYRIYMKDGGELFFFKEVPSDDRKLTIEGLINGVHYGFAISSVNEKGEGSLSTEVFATPADYPDPVKELWIEDTGDGYISLMWEPIDYDGGMEFDGYQVLRGTISTKLVNVLESTTENEFRDINVDNGVLYYYQVRSIPNTGDNIGKSEIVQGVAMGSPSRPGDLNAEGTTDTVSLTWMAPADDGGSPITGYLVYRAVGSGDMELYATLDHNETTFEDLDVSEGSYTYRIVPFSDFANGDWNEITVTIPSRTGMAAGLGALAFILPLIIILAVIFLPGVIRKRREEKERLRMKMDAKEALDREKNLLATRRGGPLLNGSVGAPGLPPVGHQAAPSLHALNPAAVGPAGNGSLDEGYIRPSDLKKRKAKDRSKLLRSDGKSLSHRESDISGPDTMKVTEKKEDWHEHRRKVLEKEASSTFIGHQDEVIKPPGEENIQEDEVIKPPKEDIEPVLDIVEEKIPDWSEGDMEMSSPPDPGDPHLEPDVDINIPQEEELEELEEMEEVDQ
ncbi:MAG: fibronectin type III domain-containing protein, partial [Thermoplasmata archaeon]|nr:fibronectin type III domain-containing protein [Thermoplasmata archaeon]